MVGGFLLIGAALIAILWANSPWLDAYTALRDSSFGPDSLDLHLTLHAWTSDGLLAVFFFLVGSELKHEFTHGVLRDPRTALVPMVATVTGAVIPAVIFFAVTAPGESGSSAGWGIPMATDAAFAVAVLAIVGRGLPSALRTMLLTLAVVDDLVAIIVIAAFYSDGIKVLPLVLA